MTNPENDFNVYAEETFLRPIEVARLAAAHELVRRKLRLFVELYTKLDPRMAAQFQTLGISTAAR